MRRLKDGVPRGSIYRLAKLYEAGYRIYWFDSSPDAIRLQSLVGDADLFLYERWLQSSESEGLPIGNGIRVDILHDETEGDAANFDTFIDTRVRPNAWQRGHFWRQDNVYIPGCLLATTGAFVGLGLFLKSLFSD